MKQLEIPDEELVMNWSNDQVTANTWFQEYQKHRRRWNGPGEKRKIKSTTERNTLNTKPRKIQ